MSKAATGYFDFYLDGKPASQSRVKPTETPRPTTGTKLAWQLRNGELKRTPDGVQISHAKQGKRQTPFLTRNGLNMAGPVTAKVVLKTTGKGEISFAWRTSEEKEFTRGNRMNVARNHSTDWQTLTATLPGDSKVIHVRMQVPDGTTTIKSIELKPTSGKTATLAE
jgi:uncharacterized sulfatase